MHAAPALGHTRQPWPAACPQHPAHVAGARGRPRRAPLALQFTQSLSSALAPGRHVHPEEGRRLGLPPSCPATGNISQAPLLSAGMRGGEPGVPAQLPRLPWCPRRWLCLLLAPASTRQPCLRCCFGYFPAAPRDVSSYLETWLPCPGPQMTVTSRRCSLPARLAILCAPSWLLHSATNSHV